MAKFRSILKQHGQTYTGEDPSLKAGVIPYFIDEGGVRHFLVAAPKATRNPNDFVPFAPARGTRKRFVTLPGGTEIEQDAGRDEIPANAISVSTENPMRTAMREAAEELGVKLRYTQLEDCKSVEYKGYGIHMFAARMKKLIQPDGAVDSRDVQWMTLQEARTRSELPVNHIDRFNPEYLPLLEAVDHAIEVTRMKSSAGRAR